MIDADKFVAKRVSENHIQCSKAYLSTRFFVRNMSSFIRSSTQYFLNIVSAYGIQRSSFKSALQEGSSMSDIALWVKRV